MDVFVDQRFVPDHLAAVSVFDRGFLYGDGLFETIRAFEGRLFLWDEHAARLEHGAAYLGIRLPLPTDDCHAAALELLRRNGLVDAIVRLNLSRGPGQRGYSPRGADRPTLVISTHPATPWKTEPTVRWRLHTSSHRLPAGDPLGALKTSCKLLHVLARAEAEEAGADEALLLNHQGHVAESAAANVFWFAGHRVFTPALPTGALAGVTRDWVGRCLAELGWPLEQATLPPSVLHAADGVFLTTSGLGIVEATHLDGRALRQAPRVETLRAAYRNALRRWLETRINPGPADVQDPDCPENNPA